MVANFFKGFLETADQLRAVTSAFEQELRDGLKAELMRVAEERIDTIVDNAVEALQTRMASARDVYGMLDLLKITIHRENS